MANDAHQLVAYCIASVLDGAGEIDSLYVSPVYRGADLGVTLIQSAMAWLSHFNCSEIRIGVAQGNEQTITFYEKFGFKKRSYILHRSF